MRDKRYTLLSESLRERFGEIYVDTVFQDGVSRVGFLRRSTDRSILTYHEVSFDPRGISALGVHHEKIVAGALLGETVLASGMGHERKDTDPVPVDIPDILQRLFGTRQSSCLSKLVTYTVEGMPYCSIREYLNPEFIRVSER